MFASSKPIASLSSSLLARKGQARPAMRSQGFHDPVISLEDLGWNDMGDAPQQGDPAPRLEVVEPGCPIAPEPVPPVLRAREALAVEIAAVAETPSSVADLDAPRAVSTATVARIGREVHAGKARSAFTLRLDPERHLRLRLASATRNRSAQALVITALDAFIASLSEVEGLAAQLTPTVNTAKRAGNKR